MTFHLGDIVKNLPHAGRGMGVIQEGLTVVGSEVTAQVGSPTTTGGLLPVMPGVPQFTSAEMPTVTGTAMAMVNDSPQPAITPQDLNQRLPSIVDNTPMVMPASISGVSQWVIDNPLMAGALLLGVAFLVFSPKGGK